jgi:two-component system sensor kinase FixL
MNDASISAQAGSERASEFDALMEAAVDAIVVIEGDGTIVSFSRAAEQMFGFARAEVIGHPVDVLMPEPYRSEHATYLDRYERTGEARIIGVGREGRGRRKSGEVFPVWLSIGESRTESGRRYVGIIRDLTEQRRAELERHSLELRLAHVSRLSLLGEMAAGIAHEINQPLSAITNYSQAAKNLLDGGHGDEETLRTACLGISEQVQRAAEVIQNLRKFVRKHEIEKARLNLAQLIGGIMVLVTADASHAGVSVVTRLDSRLPDISGNAVQLQQVILNLTRNAVDAMRGQVGRAKEIRIESAMAGSKQVEIRVSDSGPGVSGALQQAIFHPFFTTKEEGLGVGLAISRSIVEAHGGTLRYEDRQGGGSTFIVTLPILEGND